MSDLRKLVAYTAPLLAFVALLGLNTALKKIDRSIWLSSADYWIYPAQTILCGGLLIWFRREYEFHRLRHVASALLIGIIVFWLWISPQAFFGFAPRRSGFNPDIFSNQSPLYWPTVVTFGFAFSHSAVDWPVALMTGMVYNGIAYRTKSLSSCILNACNHESASWAVDHENKTVGILVSVLIVYRAS